MPEASVGKIKELTLPKSRKDALGGTSVVDSPEMCKHLEKGTCHLCQERFCMACDPNHREACREAFRP